MRLSELSSTTGVSTASLKYYLRESLLPPGEPVTRTQADYDATHVERVKLIRALVEIGGLSLAQVRAIVEALDNPDVSREEVFGVAQSAYAASDPVEHDPDWTALATAFAVERDWLVRSDDPLLPQLGAQLKALVETCDGLRAKDVLDKWANAAEAAADADVTTLTDDLSQSLKIVVVGTVLSDRVLQTMRRIAQQDRSHRLLGIDPRESEQ